jgi:hypothetical protein
VAAEGSILPKENVGGSAKRHAGCNVQRPPCWVASKIQLFQREGLRKRVATISLNIHENYGKIVTYLISKHYRGHPWMARDLTARDQMSQRTCYHVNCYHVTPISASWIHLYRQPRSYKIDTRSVLVRHYFTSCYFFISFSTFTNLPNSPLS